MKKNQILLVTFLLMAAVTFSQAKPKHRYLKPLNAVKGVTVIIDGKSKDYYPLHQTTLTEIKLTGPGKLKVLTRCRFSPGQTGKAKYEIYYVVDGGKPALFKAANVSRSIEAAYLKGADGVPGQLREFEIELGPGQHNISFRVGKNKSPVAARYAFTPAKSKKQEWIAMSPANPFEIVELVAKEGVLSYFRFSPELPLRVTLNGPTELQVLTRAEFSYNMRGAIHYRVQVKLDGKIINTYQLSSRKSETTTYKNNSQLIPGKGNEFVILVPKGKHTIELIPLDKDKNTILGRFMIPAGNVKPSKQPGK